MTLVPTTRARHAPGAGARVHHRSRHCVVPAAASPLTADVLEGPGRSATVLAALPTALYLALDDAAGRHPLARVLPVLTHDAVLLPTALVLGRGSGHVDWGVRPGDVVTVSGGRVELPAVTIVAVRRRRPARVQPLPGCRPSVLPDAGEPALAAAASDLVAAVLAGEDAVPHVRALVGRGRGLTPSGDDTLCGVLLALRAVATPAALTTRLAVGAALTPQLGRTTALSASLLLAAADGYAVPQVVRLVSAVGGGDAAGVARAVPEVLRIGHSSGADLVAGVVGALRALPAPRASSLPAADPRGVRP